MLKFDSNLLCTKNDKCVLVYIYFIFIVGLVVIYVLLITFLYGIEKNLINKNLSKDPLNKILTGDILFIGSISGWRISHFITFFIAGFIFPECICLIFILGVVWEIVEHCYSSFVIFMSKNYNLNEKNEILDGLYHKNCWDGSIEDIIFNTLGIFSGVFLREIYNNFNSLPLLNNYVLNLRKKSSKPFKLSINNFKESLTSISNLLLDP